MPTLIGKVRAPGDESVGGVEHRLERFARDDVFRTGVAGGLLAHRAGGVDEDRDRGAKALVHFGLIWCGVILRPRPCRSVGRSADPACGNQNQHDCPHQTRAQRPSGQQASGYPAHPRQLDQ